MSPLFCIGFHYTHPSLNYANNDAYFDRGHIDGILALYSGVSDSTDETLICNQGKASNSITKSVRNSSKNFNDILYSAYADVPLYKYDDNGCLYILRSVHHTMKGSVSCNTSSMAFAAGLYHSISIADKNGNEIGAVKNTLGNSNSTGTRFNYNDTAYLSAFDYAIATDGVRIIVTTRLNFSMISSNNSVVSQTGSANNNDYVSAVYLKLQ